MSNGLTALPAWLAGHDVAFVDAPVSGSSAAAEKSELVILACGATTVRPRVEPIFDVLGSKTLWLPRTGDGSRLKLALNNWLAVLVEGMVETLTLSEALGLDPHLLAGGDCRRARWPRTTRSPRAPRCSTPTSSPASRCGTPPRTSNSP